MVGRENSVTVIVKTEIRHRKKKTEIKDATITTISKNSEDDVKYTFLLNKNIKQMKKKKKNDKMKTKSGGHTSCAKNNEVKCNVCERLFSITYFDIHMKSHDALYKCDICNKNFFYLSILNIHIATHNNDALYECKLCDKTFKHSNCLSVHTTFHKWEYIKKCRFCFKTFQQFDEFHNHINRYTYDKPFLCSWCKKSFKTSQNLTDHIKVHSEDNHYLSCDICKISFAERDTIIQYIK